MTDENGAIHVLYIIKYLEFHPTDKYEHILMRL